MSRRATSRSAQESEIDSSTRSKINRYAAKIVSLQAENIKLNNDNQLLADKFNKLTEYNQTLGNDLANFDEEIVNLEQLISQKTARFKQLTKKADNLDKQISSCRKVLLGDEDFSQAAAKLKRLEEKKIAVLKRLTALKGESVSADGPGILETRALLVEEVKTLELTNSDLRQQKEILQMLVDPDKSVSQKQDALEELIKQKDKEQNRLLDEIQTLRQSPSRDNSKSTKLSMADDGSHAISEYADDEENDQNDPIKNIDYFPKHSVPPQSDVKSKEKNGDENNTSKKSSRSTKDKNDDASIESNSITKQNTDKDIESKTKSRNKRNANENNGSSHEPLVQNSKDGKEKSSSANVESSKDKSKNSGKGESDRSNALTDSESKTKSDRKKKNEKYSESGKSEKKEKNATGDEKRGTSKSKSKEANNDEESDDNLHESVSSKSRNKSQNKKADQQKQEQQKTKRRRKSVHNENSADEEKSGKSTKRQNSVDSSRRTRHSETSPPNKNKKSEKKSGDEQQQNKKTSFKGKDDNLSSRRRSNSNNSSSAARSKVQHSISSESDVADNKDSPIKNTASRENRSARSKNGENENNTNEVNNVNDLNHSSTSRKKSPESGHSHKKQKSSLTKNDNNIPTSENNADIKQQSEKKHMLSASSSSSSSSSASESAPSASINITSTSVRRKIKPQKVDCDDKETQTNDEEFDPILKGRGKELSEREKVALSKLEMLKKEIDSKLAEKAELQEKLKKPSAKFTVSNKNSVSIMPLPDAIVDLSLSVFAHHTRAVQTDVTGESIDFHTKLLDSQVSEMTVASDLQDEIANLQKQIKMANESISQAKAEGETRDQQIKKVKNDLKCAKANIESEQQNQDLETRMKKEIMNEISSLKVDIRVKQEELDQQTSKNQQMQEKLDELIKIRQSLERDLEDMSMREKPEIQTLAQQVMTYQSRVKEAQAKLQKAEEDLTTKREELNVLKKSPEMKTYKDLVIKKVKLERRLNKWKMLLKDSRETMQSLEAFSSQNYQKRQVLAETLEKYEREKADKEEELRDLESYSALLSALLHEQNENWS